MTAKNLSSTTLEKEVSFHGAGTGTKYVLAVREPLDTSPLVHDVYADTTIRGSIWDAGDAPTVGNAKGDLTIALDLSGLGTNAGGIIANDGDGAVIEGAIGTASGGTGSTAVAGWNTETGDAASAAGFAVAEMALFETTLGNRVAMINTIATAKLTVEPALPIAPAASAKIYAGVTYTPSETRTTWILTHNKDNDALGYVCTGCGLTPEITSIGAAEGKARLNLKVSVGDWDTAASTLASDDPANTFTNPGVVQSHGRFVLTDGTNTVECIASSFTVANLLTEMRRASACQPNTIGEPEIMPSQDRLIDTELWQAGGNAADPISQLRTWFDDGTMLSCMYQVGDQPGDTLALYFPACFLNVEPKEVDKSGLMAIKVQLKVSVDRNDVVLTRPFYFARF